MVCCCRFAQAISNPPSSLPRFVANRSNLFSIAGNAMIELGMDVVPKVTEEEVDKKEEVRRREE